MIVFYLLFVMISIERAHGSWCELVEKEGQSYDILTKAGQ